MSEMVQGTIVMAVSFVVLCLFFMQCPAWACDGMFWCIVRWCERKRTRALDIELQDMAVVPRVDTHDIRVPVLHNIRVPTLPDVHVPTPGDVRAPTPSDVCAPAPHDLCARAPHMDVVRLSVETDSDLFYRVSQDITDTAKDGGDEGGEALDA